MFQHARWAWLADGADEVHQMRIAQRAIAAWKKDGRRTRRRVICRSWSVGVGTSARLKHATGGFGSALGPVGTAQSRLARFPLRVIA
jgi:hypothetical protein